MIKNTKHVKFNVSIVTRLEYTNFKDDLIEYNCLCCDKDYQEKFVEKLKSNFLILPHFPTRIAILFFIAKRSLSL